MGPSGFCRNPHTLVEVTSFAAINKFQPFNVAISSNVLFLLVCALWVSGSQVWAEGWGALESDGVPGMSALCGWVPCLLRCSMFGRRRRWEGWPLPITRALHSQDGWGLGVA